MRSVGRGAGGRLRTFDEANYGDAESETRVELLGELLNEEAGRSGSRLRRLAQRELVPPADGDERRFERRLAGEEIAARLVVGVRPVAQDLAVELDAAVRQDAAQNLQQPRTVLVRLVREDGGPGGQMPELEAERAQQERARHAGGRRDGGFGMDAVRRLELVERSIGELFRGGDLVLTERRQDRLP